MALKVYNTMSQKLEEFKPVKEGRVNIYVCGPTVYDVAHIGHARTYIAFDVIIRFLEYLGYKVLYVRNITDVGHLTEDTGEDKIIKGAEKERIEPMELVDKYMNDFLVCMDKLGVKRPNIQPRATGHITEIIEAIKVLVEKGFAYVVDGSVYFDVEKFTNYGKLSKIKGDELEKHRIEPDPKKRNNADFALWKKADKGHILKWASPWGYGYPGWHIECSVMSMKYLGEKFDIHGGAKDLIFPHHENEIAQSEAFSGIKPFVKYWLHTGWLTIEGKKMAKSLGNFIPVEELLKKYDAQTFRFFVLQSHYRSPVNFSDEGMVNAKESMERFQNTFENLSTLDAVKKEGLSKEEIEFEKKLKTFKNKFMEAMEDDFNTPNAIAVLYDFSREANSLLSSSNRLDAKLLKEVKTTFTELTDILGLSLEKEEKGEKKVMDKLMEFIIKLRDDARNKEDWKTADEIRSKLKEAGIIIEDKEGKSVWKIK
jgi:cysteinyl-tRNA synthetase